MPRVSKIIPASGKDALESLAQAAMPVVTDISVQARGGPRRSVFLDGEYAFSMTLEELFEFGVAVGDQLSEERVATLAAELEARRARDFLLRLLGYRVRSESELRQRLRQKQFSDEAAERALSDLRRMGLVDDRQFAESWIRNRLAGNPMGRRRLEWELRSRGMDRQVVSESLAAVGEETEFSLALEAAERRYARLRDEEPEALRRKLTSFLQRRGFSYETVEKVVSQILPPR